MTALDDRQVVSSTADAEVAHDHCAWRDGDSHALVAV